MLFGSQKDFNVLSTHISREILKDIVEQEVGYYKLSLVDTQANLYGEALEKVYLNPVKLNCLITRGDQVIRVDDFGPDLGREASFAFLRQDLVDKVVVPEVGDIVEWHNDFYEVDVVRENQLFLGSDNNYNLQSYTAGYGRSISIIVDCHITRADRVGLTETR